MGPLGSPSCRREIRAATVAVRALARKFLPFTRGSRVSTRERRSRRRHPAQADADAEASEFRGRKTSLAWSGAYSDSIGGLSSSWLFAWRMRREPLERVKPDAFYESGSTPLSGFDEGSQIAAGVE
jgi:hypothetical protein